MRRLLLVLFLVVPLIEIGLFILIGQAIGILPTLLGVVVTALLGAALVRVQGTALIAEIRASVSAGQLPSRAIANAMMVGIAGVLLMTPGYFTDLMGIVLLVPPVRAIIYRQVAARFTGMASRGPGGRPDGPTVIDIDGENWRSR